MKRIRSVDNSAAPLSVVLLLLLNMLLIQGFTAVPSTTTSPRKTQSRSTTTSRTTSALHLSDIPEDKDATTTNESTRSSSSLRSTLNDDKGKDENIFNLLKLLPPPPEDVFTMTGDLMAIAIYGFCNHFFSLYMAGFIVASSSNGSLEPAQLPVWVSGGTDPSLYHDMIAQRVVQTLNYDAYVTHYSPILDDTGLAVTLLASCWLLAGWLFTKAFDFEHTLECRTDTCLVNAAVTWMACAALMLSIIAASNHYLGGGADASTSLLWTRGDLMFVVDSFTELTLWRYLVSTLFGNNTRD